MYKVAEFANRGCYTVIAKPLLLLLLLNWLVEAKETATKELEIEIQQLNMAKKELDSVIENQHDVIHHHEISNTKRNMVSR